MGAGATVAVNIVADAAGDMDALGISATLGAPGTQPFGTFSISYSLCDGVFLSDSIMPIVDL